MQTYKVFVALFLCLFVAGMLLTSGDCQAAGNQDIMQKKGVGGIFEGKGMDDERAPSKLQMALGIGSIFVMIIVVKWL